jgi:hypothetical protein
MRGNSPGSDLAKSIQFQVDLARSNISEEAAYVGTGGTLALYVANELGNKVARKLLALARYESLGATNA